MAYCAPAGWRVAIRRRDQRPPTTSTIPFPTTTPSCWFFKQASASPGATFQDVGGACAERYVGRGNPPAGAAGWENSFFHRRPEPFILIFPHALKRLAISRRDHDVMLDASTAGLRIRDGQPDVLGSHVPECELHSDTCSEQRAVPIVRPTVGTR